MRVAVVGDAMVDRYFVGSASRLSPEAPIPVVKVERSFDVPGGAANVAANLASLGAEVWEFLGNDRPTKNRLMVGDIQIARWDCFDRCQSVYWIEPLTVDAVVVADYGKGSITPEVIKAIKRVDRPTFVDTKGDPTPWLGIASAVFPNDKEYHAYKDAYDKFDWLVLKRSAEGLEVRQRGLPSVKIPALAKSVRSVVGAGDCVIASYVYAVLTKHPDPALYASAAAASAVRNRYTACADPVEIENILKDVILSKRAA